MRGPLFTLGLLATSALGSACGSDVDALNLMFGDELVEAPVRTVAIRGYEDIESCDEVLQLPFDDLPNQNGVLFESVEDYPINPENEPLATAPRDEFIAVDIAAFDARGVRLARGCRRFVLTDNGPNVIDVDMQALPVCEDVPKRSLDILVAIDTSVNAVLADPERLHLEEIRDTIFGSEAFGADTLFSVVTYGHQESVQEILPPTTSSTQAMMTMNGLFNVQEGKERLFDGITEASALLRARAICGRIPALVLVAANNDQESSNRFENASLGLTAERGDETDDLPLAAVVLSDAAFEIIDQLVPEGHGLVTGGDTAIQLEFAFIEVRTYLLELLLPDPEPEPEGT